MLRVAAPVAAISGVAWMALVLINMTSDFHSVVNPEDLRLFFFETPFGTVSIIRLALFATARCACFPALARTSGGSPLFFISAPCF